MVAQLFYLPFDVIGTGIVGGNAFQHLDTIFQRADFFLHALGIGIARKALLNIAFAIFDFNYALLCLWRDESTFP